MEEPVLSLEETLSILADDIRWMANAAETFDDIAKYMPDGEQKSHLEFLAACYREREESRRALIEKMRGQTPAVKRRVRPTTA
jgi:hypothetical protein